MMDITVSEQKHEVRFVSGSTVYLEGLVDGRWTGRYWGSDGRVESPCDRWTEDAFSFEIDGKPLSQGWEWVFASELPGKSRHSVIELANPASRVSVKIHTLLDGTPVLKRRLEITNESDKPIALTSVFPWASRLVANAVFWGEKDPPKRFNHPFTLGFYTKHEHSWEGWFEWKPLPAGGFSIGCDRGQCYDEPAFILRNEGTGQILMCSLAWSANWRAEFDYKEIDLSKEGHYRVNFRIGPWASGVQRVIAPGETVSAPPVHMGVVCGNLDEAVQGMHDHVRSSVLPPRSPEKTYLLEYAVPGDQGCWAEFIGDLRGFTEETVMDQIDVAAAIGAELFIVDAGWWEVQGDWEPSPKRFPRGLGPVADYCRKKGMLFGLYAEVERLWGEGNRVSKEHPEWLEWYRPVQPVLDLTMPEVEEYLAEQVEGIIERFGLDLFRIDFNTPSPARHEGKPTLRSGFEENNFWRYYEAFFRVMDGVRAKYPELILQQAACGGARNDLGMMTGFHEQYMTDGLRMPYEVQCFSGKTLFLPPEVLLIAHGADGGGGNGNAEDMDTVLRVQYGLSTPWIFHGTVAPSLREVTPERLDKYVRYGKLYKEFIRPLLPSCKVYHHAPISSRGSVESSPWFAMEFASPDRKKGWALIVRIGMSDSDTYIFHPRGLSRGEEYKITFDSTGETAEEDGLDLINDGLKIRLEYLAASEMVLFEALD